MPQNWVAHRKEDIDRQVSMLILTDFDNNLTEILAKAKTYIKLILYSAKKPTSIYGNKAFEKQMPERQKTAGQVRPAICTT